MYTYTIPLYSLQAFPLIHSISAGHSLDHVGSTHEAQESQEDQGYGAEAPTGARERSWQREGPCAHDQVEDVDQTHLGNNFK